MTQNYWEVRLCLLVIDRTIFNKWPNLVRDKWVYSVQKECTAQWVNVLSLVLVLVLLFRPAEDGSVAT